MPISYDQLRTVTAQMAVHVDNAAGHGFTPVAVCFNCWIDRRTRVRIGDDGSAQERMPQILADLEESR